MAPKKPKFNWSPHDEEVALAQGDLLVVAWVKTIAPTQVAYRANTYPALGRRDRYDLRLWKDRSPQILEMWGRSNYAMAVVITQDCAIDKELNILQGAYLREGLSRKDALDRAAAQEEGYITVAEAWPVESFPRHLRGDAANGALGYVPMGVESIIPEDPRPYAVDLSRVATITMDSVAKRLGMAEKLWALRLQTALCRYYAARAVRVSEDLARLFGEPVDRVEALTPPSGSPPRTRARIHFVGGQCIDLEAILSETPPGEIEDARRPGLKTRQ